MEVQHVVQRLIHNKVHVDIQENEFHEMTVFTKKEPRFCRGDSIAAFADFDNIMERFKNMTTQNCDVPRGPKSHVVNHVPDELGCTNKNNDDLIDTTDDLLLGLYAHCSQEVQFDVTRLRGKLIEEIDGSLVKRLKLDTKSLVSSINNEARDRHLLMKYFAHKYQTNIAYMDGDIWYFCDAGDEACSNAAFIRVSDPGGVVEKCHDDYQAFKVACIAPRCKNLNKTLVKDLKDIAIALGIPLHKLVEGKRSILHKEELIEAITTRLTAFK